MNKDNLPAIRSYFDAPNIKQIIAKRLGEKAGAFITSLLDLCSDDKNLAECDPGLIMKEALKAAALDLPINKSLGFAYVIPYKKIPSFQPGWKGLVQLAIRTGQYKHLNAGMVYEGEIMIIDRIKGTLDISGKQTSEKAIGYYSYMELLNGFQKAIGWSREKVEAHAVRFSASYAYYKKNKKGRKPVWVTDFDAMATKTLILQLISKYGLMSIDMATAISADNKADFKGFEPDAQKEIDHNANKDAIDIPAGDPEDPGEISQQEKDDIIKEEAKQAEPDF